MVPQTPLTWETILLAGVVALIPLFYLTLKNWTEALLVILAVLSIYGILKSRVPMAFQLQSHHFILRILHCWFGLLSKPHTFSWGQMTLL